MSRQERLYEVLGGPAFQAPALQESVGTLEAPETDVPPLSLAEAEELRERFWRAPEGVLEETRALWDETLTQEQLARALEEAVSYLRTAGEAADVLESTAVLFEAANALPPSFTFALRDDPALADPSDVPLQPGQHRFETIGDAAGWVVFSLPFLIKSAGASKVAYPRNKGTLGREGFVYPLASAGEDRPARVGLFSDFGTAQYQSHYIAKQFRRDVRGHLGLPPLDAAVHLGDVYYAGRYSEVDAGFRQPLSKVLQQGTPIYFLAGNHEMYSLGAPFWKYVQEQKAANGRPLQDGFHFCLRPEDPECRYQIVGGDTAYFKGGRLQDALQKEWLAEVLRYGRERNMTNILLTSDEPFSHGDSDTTDLLKKDLWDVADMVDLWFWGNTHYCALFAPSAQAPFVGSCIGHAGYPYSRKPKPKQTLGNAPAFLETATRFPEWTGVRKDRGNNGFCELELHRNGDVKLTYVDWLGCTRCVAQVNWGGGAKASITLPVDVREEGERTAPTKKP